MPWSCAALDARTAYPGGQGADTDTRGESVACPLTAYPKVQSAGEHAQGASRPAARLAPAGGPASRTQSKERDSLSDADWTIADTTDALQ